MASFQQADGESVSPGLDLGRAIQFSFEAQNTWLLLDPRKDSVGHLKVCSHNLYKFCKPDKSLRLCHVISWWVLSSFTTGFLSFVSENWLAVLVVSQSCFLWVLDSTNMSSCRFQASVRRRCIGNLKQAESCCLKGKSWSCEDWELYLSVVIKRKLKFHSSQMFKVLTKAMRKQT